MDGSAIAATTVECTLRAFTDNACMVPDLYRGGIPVWYICPAQDFDSSINILSVVFLQEPEKSLVLEAASPPFPVVFTGSAADPAKNHAIHVYSRSFLTCSDLFMFKCQAVTPPQSFLAPGLARTTGGEIQAQGVEHGGGLVPHLVAHGDRSYVAQAGKAQACGSQGGPGRNTATKSTKGTPGHSCTSPQPTCGIFRD